MPATYRHVVTSEQIEGRYRNPRKKPEPPPKPKPKQYFVLGMEVDYNTYREYNYEKSWTIDSDVLKGISCTLWSLERWATDEHAREYPIESANARKILEQIRDEINATINGKEEYNMSNPKTAADFISALKEVYNESRSAYDTLQDKVNKAKAKMDRAYEDMRDPACKNTSIASAKYDIAKGEHRIAEDAARSEYRAMASNHEKKVAELRSQFAAYLDDYYSASPDKLDAATMQLLNSGICTPSELSRLVDRHADNPTMLRIVGNYARNMRTEKENSMSHEDVAICAAVTRAAFAAKDGSRELAIFDTAVASVAYGLGNDYDHATRMHSHVSGWIDDFKNQIVNLPTTPYEPGSDGSDAGNE